MTLAIFLLLPSVLIVGVELSKRAFSLSTNLTRKIAHIGGSLIACATPIFLSKEIIVSLCLLFAILIFLSRSTKYLSSIHAVDRKTYGDVFLPLGEALAAMVFLPHNVAAFQFGVLVMGISDAMAGIVGERYGTHPLHFFRSNKTLEGAATFFVCTLFISLFFSSRLSGLLFPVALLLTLLELGLIYGLDNLVLPISAGFLLMLLA
jgi:phytol kinase